MNTWQLWKLNKFKLKEEDLKLIRINYLTIVDWKKTHKEFAEFKHFMCKCWNYELLWFIDKFENKCRFCASFVNK